MGLLTMALLPIDGPTLLAARAPIAANTQGFSAHADSFFVDERNRSHPGQMSFVIDPVALIDSGMNYSRIESVAFSDNDQPVEWRISYVNTERYEYCAAGNQ